MATPSLAYALLKATYSENVRNPADVIIPLIKRSLFQYGNNPVRPEVVQQRIMDIWGLEVPLNIIQYSFPRLATQRILRLDKNTHQYHMVDNNYKDDIIIGTEKQAREKYSVTIQRFTRVIIDLGITSISGNDVLDGWLDTSSLSFLGGANPASSANLEDKKIQRIVTIALTSYEFSLDLQTDLTVLCLGDSLYRAVKSLSEYSIDEIGAADIRQKMDNVDVYFDTSLLISVLGYSRDELNKGATELLSMCKSTGCKLKIFQHNLAELEGIIRGSATLITSGRFERREFGRDFVAYALEHGIEPGDLIELAANVEGSLTALGFAIVATPQIEIALSVDERELEVSLQETLATQTYAARFVDINSLTAIYRLRQGQPQQYLESCMQYS